MYQVVSRNGIPFEKKKVKVKMSAIDENGNYREWEVLQEVLIDPLLENKDYLIDRK